MKKLSLYIFLVLMFCNVGFAENKIILKDLKINSNITNYFSQKEIDLYRYDEEGKYGKNEIYSLLYIKNPNEKFNENFSLIMIAYNNKSWKIHYTAGLMENLNNCIKFRDEQINAYKTIFKNYKKRIATSEHSDGLKQEIISFRKGNLRAKFTCDYYSESSPYAGTVDFRVDFLTDTFNTWVVRAEGTTTN